MTKIDAPMMQTRIFRRFDSVLSEFRWPFFEATATLRLFFRRGGSEC
jgi:hypothetical protein